MLLKHQQRTSFVYGWTGKLIFVCGIYLLMRPQLHKGVSGARGNDTLSLKGTVLDLIVPIGQTLNSLLNWNKKDDCGFKHERIGLFSVPSTKIGLTTSQWSTLLYSGTYDPMDSWNGLLHNNILVKVSNLVNIYQLLDSPWPSGIQVHFHIAHFSQCGGQGNPIRQCSYPQYGMCNTQVNCVHCYSGNLYIYIC